MDLVLSFVHELSIAQRIHQLMLNFNGLTRYPKKSKTSDQYKELETDFLHDADKLFNIFCYDNKQRKPYESIYGLRITFNNNAFFEDQKAEPKATSLVERFLTIQPFTSNIKLESFSS